MRSCMWRNSWFSIKGTFFLIWSDFSFSSKPEPIIPANISLFPDIPKHHRDFKWVRIVLHSFHECGLTGQTRIMCKKGNDTDHLTATMKPVCFSHTEHNVWRDWILKLLEETGLKLSSGIQKASEPGAEESAGNSTFPFRGRWPRILCSTFSLQL